MTDRTVHVVLPNDIDDPAMPSGGNVYDRRVCSGLAELGWSVREHAVSGGWPRPSEPERAGFTRTLARLPDEATVLVDGLVASAVPEALAAQRRRLRLVILLHMPVHDDREARALTAAAAVVTTSGWTRQQLLAWYALPAERIHVAPPGTDPAPVVPGSAGGGGLLCVAAVTPHKGHDVLLDGLAGIADLPWHCVCVGSLDRDAAFAARTRDRARAHRISHRITFAGPRTGAELRASYAEADLLLLASRAETYGMVVTEALAGGTPVLASSTGGIAEALGRAPDGSLPGLLVPPADPVALGGGLRRWLSEPDLRDRLRRAALARRTTLTGWSVTSAAVSRALSASGRAAGAGPEPVDPMVGVGR